MYPFENQAQLCSITKFCRKLRWFDFIRTM